MLKVTDLTKSYDKSIVLDNINLDIEAGKFTTLLGPNGCGKSTLLNVISGFELADSGKIDYKNESPSDFSFSHKHDICFIHEKLDYIVPMFMDRFVDIYRERIPKWDQSHFDQMVKDRKINLHTNFQSYSRGQKMQVALMIGIASSAPVLLLDEITSVIDVYGRKYFLDLLDQYVKSGKTVVMTTNIINELEFYTDNLVILKDKKVVLNGKVTDLPRHFMKLRKQVGDRDEVFDDPQCVWAGLNSDRSVSYVIANKLLNKYNLREEIIDKRQSSLEDIFVYYFSHDEGQS